MSTTTARPPTLAGRTAIVTGASSGIGRATAAVLVERGARIAGLARDHVRLDSLARELGRACVPVALDLSDVGAIDALPERLPDGFATPDLLVNCAGHDLGGRRPFHEAAAEDWSDALAVNLIGLMRLTQVVLKGMLRRGSGDIVNLGSITSRRIWPGQAAYVASKHGVHGFSEALRADLGASDIRVIEIVPGVVRTEFAERRLRGDQPGAEKYYGSFPGTLEPGDVARAIAWAVEQPREVTVAEIVLLPTRERA
jgi:3-hydroxy acid dehydrogenase/malonic semialdehyde reductase